MVVVSIVSHLQIELVSLLLNDFLKFGPKEDYIIILTINLPEDLAALRNFESLPIRVVLNESPKGFGANHNCAFNLIKSDIFVVLNPDIRLLSSFDSIFYKLRRNEVFGIIAPKVLDSNGRVDDSARVFPTVLSVVRRLLSKSRTDYVVRDTMLNVDWVGGMFMTFRAETYADVSGFDEAYFMYMEDVDICYRIKNMLGKKVLLDPEVTVVHDARRMSRKRLKYLKWHVNSYFIFFSRKLGGRYN